MIDYINIMVTDPSFWFGAAAASVALSIRWYFRKIDETL